MGWFSIRDIDRLTPFIAVFGDRLANSLEEETKQTYDRMIDQWEQGNDALGRAWEPNAPSTVARKGSSTPLIETRQMIESADYTVDKDELRAQIYIDDEDGKVMAHEHGLPDLGIPARPILGPTADYFGKEADDIFKKAFAKSWLTAEATGTAINVAFGNKLGGGR